MCLLVENTTFLFPPYIFPFFFFFFLYLHLLHIFIDCSALLQYKLSH